MQLVQPGDRSSSSSPAGPRPRSSARPSAPRSSRSSAARRRPGASPSTGWPRPRPRHAHDLPHQPQQPHRPAPLPRGPPECVAIARRAGAWLLVDEVYAGLEWDAPRAPSIAGLYERGSRLAASPRRWGSRAPDRVADLPRPGLVMDGVILRENASEIMNILGEHIAEIALRPERLGRAGRARARPEPRPPRRLRRRPRASPGSPPRAALSPAPPARGARRESSPPPPRAALPHLPPPRLGLWEPRHIRWGWAATAARTSHAAGAARGSCRDGRRPAGHRAPGVTSLTPVRTRRVAQTSPASYMSAIPRAPCQPRVSRPAQDRRPIQQETHNDPTDARPGPCLGLAPDGHRRLAQGRSRRLLPGEHRLAEPDRRGTFEGSRSTSYNEIATASAARSRSRPTTSAPSSSPPPRAAPTW
jgi:hypothetical protein